MFVRTASERDLAAVRELLVETWHATYDAIYGRERVTAITEDWHSPSALRENLARPYSEFIVADDGRALAGMAYASATDAGRTTLLHQLYVRPVQQGRGIGGLLLDDIEGSFHDARKIRLEVEEANARAVAFYLAQGFAEVGRTNDCGKAGSGIPALVFERPINWAPE